MNNLNEEVRVTSIRGHETATGNLDRSSSMAEPTYDLE